MEQNGNPHPEWETFDDDEGKDFSEKYDRDNIKERNKSDSWPLSSKVNGTTNVNRDLTHSAAAEAMNETTPLCAEEVSFKSLFRQNWHPTIVYCSVFWSFGMCVAFLGPTLLDLGCQTSTDLNHMSWVFFAQLLCTLIGSIAAGYLVRSCEIDPISTDVIILVSTILIPFSMFVVPFCGVLSTLGVVLALMGLNMGVIDCLANLQMISLYGELVAPFLQAMHFCYGFGAFVSPMIAEPFLLNEDCTPFIIGVENMTDADGLIPLNDSSLPAHSVSEAQRMTHVKYAFWLMSLVQLPIPLLVCSLVFKDQLCRALRNTFGDSKLFSAESTLSVNHSAAINGDMELEGKGETKFFSQFHHIAGIDPKTEFKISKKEIIGISALTALILFMYDGLQSVYGGYVYSYALKSIVGLNKTEGAYLNALFWGTFALGRLVSIPLATKFSSAFMLICNISGCVISMILILSLRHNHIALYFGTAFFGAFLSSVAPTTISLAEQFIDINSTITTVIIVSAAMGEMIFPVIVGQMFVDLGPVSFLIFECSICIFSLLVYVAIWMAGSGTSKYKATSGGSFVWCSAHINKHKTHEKGTVKTTVKYYSRMSESVSDTDMDEYQGIPGYKTTPHYPQKDIEQNGQNK